MSEVDHASNWDRLIFALEFVVNSEINMELTTSQCKYLLDKLTSLTDRIADLEADPRWIPVSERLPDYGVIVLVVYAGNRVGEAFRQPRMKPIVGWGEWSASSVTHWMPLPPPPEDK